MRENSNGRAVILGEYILDTGATVRATAKVFKVSKSTVHKDVTKWNGTETPISPTEKHLYSQY